LAYKRGNREQLTMLPPTIEEYVRGDDPVRAYDAFVEALNLEELGIKVDEDRVGQLLSTCFNVSRMITILGISGIMAALGWLNDKKLMQPTHISWNKHRFG